MSNSSSSIYVSSFLNIENASFISGLYEQYLKDPSSVDESWRGFFQSFSGKDHNHQDYLTKDNFANNSSYNSEELSYLKRPAISEVASATDSIEEVSDGCDILNSIKVFRLVNAYRSWGHFKSNLDPLNIEKISKFSDLEIENYGFSSEDTDKKIFVGGL